MLRSAKPCYILTGADRTSTHKFQVKPCELDCLINFDERLITTNTWNIHCTAQHRAQNQRFTTTHLQKVTMLQKIPLNTRHSRPNPAILQYESLH